MIANLGKVFTRAPVHMSTFALRPSNFARFYSAKKFTKTHEWVELQDKIATIGITKHAAESLGEIVFAELPEVGKEVSIGENLGIVESVKAVGEIDSPVTGTIVANNEDLNDNFDVISNDPESEGWLCKVEVEDIAQVEGLMGEKEYKEFLTNEEH